MHWVFIAISKYACHGVSAHPLTALTASFSRLHLASSSSMKHPIRTHRKPYQQNFADIFSWPASSLPERRHQLRLSMKTWLEVPLPGLPLRDSSGRSPSSTRTCQVAASSRALGPEDRVWEQINGAVGSETVQGYVLSSRNRLVSRLSRRLHLVSTFL